MRSGAFEPFDARDDEAMGAGAGRRMDRQEREGAEPVLDRGEDRRERVRAVDHHEPPAGREDRETGPNPARERRAGLRRREDMRPRAPWVGRDANRPGSKNGGLVTTQSAASSASPASRRSPGFRTSSLRTRARACKSVARGIDPGEPGQLRIDLDEIGERPRGLPDAAPARPRRRPRRRRRSGPPASPPRRRAGRRPCRPDGRASAGRGRAGPRATGRR